MKKRKKNNSKNISKTSLVIAVVFIALLAISGYTTAKLSREAQIEESEKTSGADLSYLVIHVDESVQMVVTAPDGSVAHELYNGIEKSIFDLSLPIVNYKDPSKVLGKPFWEFEQKYPSDGVYEILLQSGGNEDAMIWIASYDKEGEKFLFDEYIQLNETGKLFLLNNDPLNSSNTTLTIK